MFRISKLIDSRTLMESNKIIVKVNTKLDTQIQALSGTLTRNGSMILKD
ncbi:4926_t:CDS:1, partial [Gigaspora rosea]